MDIIRDRDTVYGEILKRRTTTHGRNMAGARVIAKRMVGPLINRQPPDDDCWR